MAETLLTAEELTKRANEKIEELNKENTEETPKEDESEVETQETNEVESKENDSSTNIDNEDSESTTEKVEKTEDELKAYATENNIPKSISLAVVKEWEKIPEEARKSMVKLANDADRFATSIRESEKQASERNKELGDALSYLKYTAKNNNISETQVIKNVVNWVQAIEDNPDSTLNAAIGKVIQIKDPISLINTIMQRYSITEETLKEPRSFSDRQKLDYQIREEARRRAEHRESVYKDLNNDEQKILEIQQDLNQFSTTHDQEVLNDKTFVRIVQLERANNPEKSTMQVLEDAYSFFQQIQQPKNVQQPTKQEQTVTTKKAQPVDIEKKLNAVSLKSTPNTASVEKPMEYDPTNLSKTISELKLRVSKRLNN